jgi:hypothetical protein
MLFRLALVSGLFLQSLVSSAFAQNANAELEVCPSSDLVALKERNQSISNVWLDMDGVTVASASTALICLFGLHGH